MELVSYLQTESIDRDGGISYALGEPKTRGELLPDAIIGPGRWSCSDRSLDVQRLLQYALGVILRPDLEGGGLGMALRLDICGYPARRWHRGHRGLC
jgi:hypothetical protein